MERTILKWCTIAQEELHCFKDLEQNVKYICDVAKSGLVTLKELSDDRGLVAYMICPDMRGNMMCSELFMYVRPEKRGNINTFKEIIDILETAGKENNCKYVSIGSNIGYRDEKVLSLLSRFGYKVDTVKKEIS